MRKEKQYLLDEIKSQIDSKETYIIMNYANIEANQMNTFRGELAESGSNLEMVKKRVFLKAVEDSYSSLSLDALPGHIGLVLAGEDPLTAIKVILKLSKETDKQVSILAGKFEGEPYSGEQLEALSKLPSKDEMRAQLVGLLQAPMAQTLAVMNALLASVPTCMEQKLGKESNQ